MAKKKRRKLRKSFKISLIVAAILIVATAGLIVYYNLHPIKTAEQEADASAESTITASSEPTETPAETATPEPTETPAATEEAQQTAASDGCGASGLDSQFTDTNSLLVLANKKHPLPEGYIPPDLVDAGIPCTNGSATMRAEAAQALQQMYQAAANDGVALAISSAYRGESYQATLYNNYVAQYGQAEADTISSRPGYSDHQTGLAADFVEGGAYDLQESFENTASGIWLRTNAHLYGFIMRYPKGKAAITGYDYEPWHYRYIGVANATNVYNVDVFESFEEYYNVSGGDYCN